MLPRGPLVLPGLYEVRLTVDGKTSRQPLTVKMDPRVKTPPADLARQFDLGIKIWQALEESSKAGSSNAALRRINSSLASLAAVVDSADRAPTAQAEAAYQQARRDLDAALQGVLLH